MRTDQDPFLAQLFAQHDQDSLDDDCLRRFIDRLDREKRKQRIYIAAASIAIALLATTMAPWISQSMSVITDVLTAMSMVSLGPLPRLGWLVGGAFAIAVLPVLYLWRTARW